MKRIFHYLPFVLVFSVAVIVRVVAIRYPFGDYDEGVYLATVRSVAHGFSLISQTYNSQGPLFIYAAELFYRLSPTIWAVRMLAVLSSLAVIGLTYLLLDKRIGRMAALFAATYLALDTIFLVVSRTFQVDMPWLAVSFAAFYFLLQFHETARLRDMVLSAAFLSLGLLLKANPIMAIVVGIYILYAVSRHGWRVALRAACYPIVFSVVLLLTVPAHDFARFYVNTVAVRTSHVALTAGLWLTGSRRLLLSHEWPLFFLDGLAAVWLAREAARARSICRAVDRHMPLFLLWTWLLVTVLAFSVYSPLFPHHLVFLILPALLVASPIVQEVWDGARRHLAIRLVVAVAVAAIVGYGATQGVSLAAVLTPLTSGYDRSVLAAAGRVKQITGPRDYVVMDDQIGLYLADRNTPPDLVDTSFVRIQSGLLSSVELEADIDQFQPTAVALLSGRLAAVPGFAAYLKRHYHEEDLATGGMLFVR